MVDDLYQSTTIKDRKDNVDVNGETKGDGDWYSFYTYKKDLLEEFEDNNQRFVARCLYRYSIHSAFMSVKNDMHMLRSILIGRM